MDESRTLEESNQAGSAATLYEINDDINLYLTASRGHKSGGFNATAANTDDIEYEPEQSDTWEAGVKGRYFDGSMIANVGLYRTLFDNQQVISRRGGGALNGFIATNAASSVVQGLIAYATNAPTQWLRLNMNLAYNDAKYREYPDAPCPEDRNGEECDLGGKTFPFTPEWKGAISPSVILPIAQIDALAIFRLDAIYNGFEYQELDLDPIDSREAFWQFNAGFILRSMDERWTLAIQGMNLSDEVIRIRSGDVELAGGSHFTVVEPPRRAVASISYRFE